jgi:chemotaxis protein methyltransferase CheR
MIAPGQLPIPPRASAQGSQDLDRTTFERIRKLVYAKSGIVLEGDKTRLVAARLAGRLRELGIATPRAYLAHLESKHGTEELTHLVDAMSTNVTSFFREPEHFDFLTQLHARWMRAGQRRFRYWCAACSSGEEAYSLAMTLHELGGQSLDLRILATDISTAMLRRAMAGVYADRAVTDVPRRMLRRYFERRTGELESQHAVQDELRHMLEFRHLNLARLPLPLAGPLDAILCRNVMIYFDRELRSRLVLEFARLLKPGGCLLISHSESLIGVDNQLVMVRPSLYFKPGAARR